jgi:hypothetical protein
VRLKAKNGWAVDGRDIDLKDRRKYITSQSFEVMIALELFLRGTGFLEEDGEFRDLSLHHHGNTTSQAGGSCHCGALCLGVTSSAFINRRVDDNWVVSRPLSHGVQCGSSAARMKIARKIGRQEQQNDGMRCAQRR